MATGCFLSISEPAEFGANSQPPPKDWNEPSRLVTGLSPPRLGGHGLHVMTRNTADFEPTGVLLLNPSADGR
jgi:hypothetical protein